MTDREFAAFVMKHAMSLLKLVNLYKNIRESLRRAPIASSNCILEIVGPRHMLKIHFIFRD